MIALMMWAALGQEIQATTVDGRSVVLRPDGTWAFAAPSQPTAAPSPSGETPTEPAAANSPTCSEVIKTEADRMSGKSYTSMVEPIIASADGETGLVLDVLEGSGSVIWTINAFGASACMDEGSEINILFSDETRLALRHDAGFNCDRSATVYFGGVFGKARDLQTLQTKRIAAMRVWTSDGYVERELDPTAAERLRVAFSCLSR